jgi:hypothetical protein
VTYPRIRFFPGVYREDLLDLSDDPAEQKELQREFLGLIAAVGRGEIRGQECGWQDETGNLMDCRKLYFDTAEGGNRYRGVYRCLPDEQLVQEIEVLAVGLKGEYRDPDYIYRVVAERLGRI